jgi:hypothetical protein
MEEIKRHWAEFLAQPFPRGYVGEGELAESDVDLAELDTFAAGCIDTFIAKRGKLDAERVIVLERCIEKLKILSELFDENNPKQKAYIRYSTAYAIGEVIAASK